MRKLKLLMQMSVDGFIATDDGRTDWMIWNWGPEWKWDPELQKYFVKLTASIDCILLSRQMAEEGFINHWANTAERNNDPQAVFAKIISAAHKVVFTKKLEKSTWENTSLAKGDLSEEVNTLKNKDGKDLIVYGGASFVSSLINENLIDEFYLFINPVAIGSGLKIFDNTTNLALETAIPFKCGMTVLKYQSMPYSSR